ncbi:MAG: glycosyltransferase family 1 protein, partial [Acidimicrobiia bacterium]
MSSLLITNDFPPKLGGIQTYLGEVWRRLAPTDPIILAPTVAGCAEHDAEFPAEIIRLPHRVLLPTPELRRRVRALIAERDPSMVFIDPIMPLGMIGPGLGVPYVVLGHGAEISGYARLQPSRAALLRILKHASGAIVSGDFPASILHSIAPIPVLSVPPGVDSQRFRPLTSSERNATRTKWNIPVDATVVLGLSRLVPRKGFDRFIESMARIPDA